MHYFHLGTLNSRSNVDLCTLYRAKNYCYSYFCYCNVVAIIRPLTVTTIPVANMYYGFLVISLLALVSFSLHKFVRCLLVTRIKTYECEVSSSGEIQIPSYSKIILFILMLKNADPLETNEQT